MCDDNMVYFPKTVEHTKYSFIGIADGKIFLAKGNEAKPNGNVTYLGSSGKYRLLEDGIIWAENLTQADIPDRKADGIVDDGTDNEVWLISYKEWLGLVKKNFGR